MSEKVFSMRLKINVRVINILFFFYITIGYNPKTELIKKFRRYET